MYVFNRLNGLESGHFFLFFFFSSSEFTLPYTVTHVIVFHRENFFGES